MGIANQFQEWFSRPFDEDGSVINWALFVLLILVLIAIWSKLVSYMTRAIPG